jgi:hypothetical protein
MIWYEIRLNYLGSDRYRDLEAVSMRGMNSI